MKAGRADLRSLGSRPFLIDAKELRTHRRKRDVRATRGEIPARRAERPESALPAAARKEEGGMIKLSVMYPHKEGATFDMEYYCSRHMPMVQQKVGAALKGVAVDQGIAGAEPGSGAPFLAIGHLLFESLEALETSFGPHEAAIEADIPNYTNIQPTIQISEVKM
jgi:uncharacterized protein (TIGR02118 family)